MAVGRGDMPQRCLWTGWALPRGNCREAAEKASFEMPDGRSEMPQSYLQGSLALRSGVRGLQRETSTTLQIPLWHMGAPVRGSGMRLFQQPPCRGRQENRDGTEVSAGQVSSPVQGKAGGALNQY